MQVTCLLCPFESELTEGRASRSPQVGVLTDSSSWTVCYFVSHSEADFGGDMYQSLEFITADATSQAQILGTCVRYFVLMSRDFDSSYGRSGASCFGL